MPAIPPRAGDTGPGGPVAAARSGPVDPGPTAPWSDPDAAFYTVGQVGDLLGVPAATLRRFDSLGAVRPARSTGGQRRYSHRQLEHARRLLRLVDEGLPLAAATRVADLEDTVVRLQQQLTEATPDDATPDGRTG